MPSSQEELPATTAPFSTRRWGQLAEEGEREDAAAQHHQGPCREGRGRPHCHRCFVRWDEEGVQVAHWHNLCSQVSHWHYCGFRDDVQLVPLLHQRRGTCEETCLPPEFWSEGCLHGDRKSGADVIYLAWFEVYLFITDGDSSAMC